MGSSGNTKGEESASTEESEEQVAKLLYDVGGVSLYSPELMATPLRRYAPSDPLVEERPMPESRDEDWRMQCGG